MGAVAGADICGDKLCGVRDHNVLEQLPGEFTSLHFYLLRQIRFLDLQRQSLLGPSSTT